MTLQRLDNNCLFMGIVDFDNLYFQPRDCVLMWTIFTVVWPKLCSGTSCFENCVILNTYIDYVHGIASSQVRDFVVDFRIHYRKVLQLPN